MKILELKTMDGVIMMEIRIKKKMLLKMMLDGGEVITNSKNFPKMNGETNLLQMIMGKIGNLVEIIKAKKIISDKEEVKEKNSKLAINQEIESAKGVIKEIMQIELNVFPANKQSQRIQNSMWQKIKEILEEI